MHRLHGIQELAPRLLVERSDGSYGEKCQRRSFARNSRIGGCWEVLRRIKNNPLRASPIRDKRCTLENVPPLAPPYFIRHGQHPVDPKSTGIRCPSERSFLPRDDREEWRRR
jgi:hypothetical protein